MIKCRKDWHKVVHWVCSPLSNSPMPYLSTDRASTIVVNSAVNGTEAPVSGLGWYSELYWHSRVTFILSMSGCFSDHMHRCIDISSLSHRDPQTVEPLHVFLVLSDSAQNYPQNWWCWSNRKCHPVMQTLASLPVTPSSSKLLHHVAVLLGFLQPVGHNSQTYTASQLASYCHQNGYTLLVILS